MVQQVEPDDAFTLDSVDSCSKKSIGVVKQISKLGSKSNESKIFTESLQKKSTKEHIYLKSPDLCYGVTRWFEPESNHEYQSKVIPPQSTNHVCSSFK